MRLSRKSVFVLMPYTQICEVNFFNVYSNHLQYINCVHSGKSFHKVRDTATSSVSMLKYKALKAIMKVKSDYHQPTNRV